MTEQDKYVLFWRVFFATWLIGGGLFLVFDQYIVGGLLLGSFVGLFIRTAGSNGTE